MVEKRQLEKEVEMQDMTQSNQFNNLTTIGDHDEPDKLLQENIKVVHSSKNGSAQLLGNP